MPNLSLLDLFRSYPGGVAALAEKSGVPLHTVYRIAHGSHARPPIRALSALAEALSERPLLGESWRFDRVVQKWEDARAMATAG